MEEFLLLFKNPILKDDNFKINYNEEQLIFIKSPIENSKLLGIPGGGKTQSIIGKVLYHHTKDKILNNNFLILTFSRRACNDFIEKGKKSNKKLFTKKNIRTLHSLSGKIVYHILEKRSSSQDTVIISSLDLLEKSLETKLETTNELTLESNHQKILALPEFQNLKVIFVDEAQDISQTQYDFILKISKLTQCAVIMIGDPNQNIYQFQNGSDQFLLNHFGKTYTLTKNYRSTPHIVNLINYFRPWTSLTTQMISTKPADHKHNYKPVIFTGSIDEIIRDVINKILKSPFPLEEIAIIGPVKKSKPYQDFYTNIGLSLFTNLLGTYNINYIKHYEDSNSEESDFNEFKKVKNHVNLFTIHGSKGLEFDQVFLLNFHTTTFGIIPTESKYKEFKYLWYVGLSRASYNLTIYIDKSKMPWDELKQCPSNLYLLENGNLNFSKTLKFQDEIVPIYYTVTEILNSKKMMNEQSLYYLEKIFHYEVEKIFIFSNNNGNNDNNNGQIKEYKAYCKLYGIFIENIFNYYYCKKWNIMPDFITKLKKIINNTIIIPKQFISGYKVLKIRCPFIVKNLVRLSDFSSIKNNFKHSEELVYSYLCETLEYDYNKEFFIDCSNDVIYYSKEDLLNIIDFLENSFSTVIVNDIKINSYLFKITLFYYQREHECAYLWNYDFSEHLRDLDYYISEIIDYVQKLEEKFTFHPTFRHPKLPIVGELDLMNEQKIIDIKFSSSLNVKHILQLLLYAHIIDPAFQKNYSTNTINATNPISLELWNFQLGYKYIIKLDKEKLNTYNLLKILSKGINKKLENMIFFYDLETTGLLSFDKKIDIIERYFEEYSTGIIPSQGLLKQNYTNFITPEISALTGITNEMVIRDGEHISKFKNELETLLDFCNKPIFIAHNGNSFDHKILIEEKILNYGQCKLLDSKMIIRLFLDNDVSEKSLVKIFEYLFHFSPVAHRACNDVKMLISIFRALNITEDKIKTL